MNKIAKAIAAAVMVAFALYQTAQGVDSPGGSDIVSDELVTIGVYAAFSFVTTYFVPNAPKKTTPSDGGEN